MNDTQPNSVAAPRKGNGRKYLFLFLIGLVMGAIGTVMLMRAWQARQDPFPDSVMHVQEWHLKQLKNRVTENRCAATDTLPHVKALRTTADDLEWAFPDLKDDARFGAHASKFRAALDGALASPPLNCAGVGAMNKQVQDACGACHQDFKG